MEEPNFGRKPLVDGEPCGHPGCLSHVSHPCEGCGRIQGRERTGVAQAKAMALDAGSRMEQLSNELAAGSAYVARTHMSEDPNDPYVTCYVTEIVRSNGTAVTITERSRRKKCPGPAVTLGDPRGICTLCGRPAAFH